MSNIPPFLVYDIEANGLYDDWYKQNATHIWCVCFLDQDKNETIFVRDDLIGFHTEWRPLSQLAFWLVDNIPTYKAIVCHNQIGYDLRMLKKFLGIDYSIKPDTLAFWPIEIVDTLLDSKWLNPKRMLPFGCPGSIKPANGGKSKIIGPHGLEAWGYRASKRKPAIEDWENLSIEQYVERCLEDVRINWETFRMLNDEIAHYFKGSAKLEHWLHNRNKARMPIDIEHGFKADIVVQEENGVPFNKAKAEALLPIFDKELDELRTRIESHLPSIPIPASRLKDWQFPARPFDKKGEPTSFIKKWVNKWNGTYGKGEDGKWWVEIIFEGEKRKFVAPFPQYLRTTEQMTVESEHLAQYIVDTYGWRPMYWNYQVDQKTKRKMRDADKKLIPTTPRFKDAQSGRICPHLESLEVPFVKDVIRYRTVKHRRSTVESSKNEEKGYLNHPRLAVDSCIPAGMDTIGAATSRVTHKGLCNVPKADEDVLYGAELRDLFWHGGDPDWYFLGYDASGLEARLEGSEAFEFDHGDYAMTLLSEDIHAINAEFFGIKRGSAKNVKYALGYGAGVAKVAQMLNVSLPEAHAIVEAWWEKYWAVRKAIDKITCVWKKNGKKFIYGIDGRPIPMESPHLVLNYRLQNAGTVAMKLHACIMRQKVMELANKNLVKKVIDYHDECQWLVHKSLIKFKVCQTIEEAKKYQRESNCAAPILKDGKIWTAYCVVGKMGVQSINEAGKQLGLKVDLTGEYKIGRSWKDCH